MQKEIQLEYVWQGGLNKLDLRCKTRTWTSAAPPTLETLPIWNYDGSSTGQAPGHDSEVRAVAAAASCAFAAAAAAV